MSAEAALRINLGSFTEIGDVDETLLRAVPLPVAMKPAAMLTDEELLDFCRANKGLDIECDADGTITIMTPAGPGASHLNSYLTRELSSWAEGDSRGVDFGPDLGIRFPDHVMRGPDAAWLSKDRWNSLDRSAREKFLPFCPEFIVELRSPSDRASRVEAKMEFWMNRGAQLGWLIDPQRKLAMIYRPGQEPETLLQPELLDGEGPIAGFRLKMQRFWE
jgi:Uma2 family endonuclease